LRACSKALATVDIEHGHYQDVFFKAEKGDTVYFDPPYVPISSTASFTSYTRDGFGPNDQIALRDLAWELKRRGVQVILSNHDVPEVRELYADFDIKQILVGRAINSKGSKRGRVPEVIIT
jgi:DNA adenine methylase